MADVTQDSGPAWDLYARIHGYMQNTETVSQETIDGFEAEMVALKCAGTKIDPAEVERIRNEIDKMMTKR
jgi:hypothetical protein